MKKVIPLFFCILFANIAFTQCPQKTALGSTINRWDWRSPQYKVYLETVYPPQATYIHSPFEGGATEPNLNGFSSATVRDYAPEDGWELLAKNLGDSTYRTDKPFFVLYNRYEARIRLFFHPFFPPNLTSPQRVLYMYFDRSYEQTGLLEHINGVSNSVETQANGIVANVPNLGLPSSIWYHADIQVAYDPCTCANKSLLLCKMNTSPVSNVVLRMKETDEILKFFVKEDQIEDFDAMQDVFPWYNNNGGIQGFGSMNDIKRLFQNHLSARLAAKIPADDLKNALPSWAASHATNNNAEIGMFDFISAGGKKTTIEAMPMASNSATYFNSYSTSRPLFELGGAIFATPGSYQEGFVPQIIPFYNNILGTFNLLEQPTLANSTDYLTEGEGRARKVAIRLRYKLDDDISYVINPASGLSQTPESIRGALFFTFKKDNPLQPAEGLIKEYEIKGGNMVTYRTPYLPLGCLNAFVATFQSTYNQSFILPTNSGVTAVLQVVANLKRDTLTDPFPNPSANNVLFASKYFIKEHTSATTIQATDLSSIPFDRTISNLNLTENTTLYAWNIINIGSNIQTNGHTLTLISNNEIKRLTSAPLPTGVILQIGSPTSCSRIVPAKDPTYIQSFCGSSRYNPSHTITYPPVADTSGSDIFMVFPNPAHNSTRISIGVSENMNGILFMTDILGRNIENLYFSGEFECGTTHFDLNIENLDRGFYFITLKKENGTLKTLKFLKE